MDENLRMDSVWERLREASEFFAKRGKVHTTLERLARRLDAESIPYAIIGGMALNLHGYEHVTCDLNVLMTSANLQKYVDRCGGRDYTPTLPGATKSFIDSISQVSIKIAITGEYPGDGKPKPVSFPDPATASVEMEGIRVITLEKLIELKLASGLSAPHRQLIDLADVQRLIEESNLPLDLAGQLDESVRAEYRRLWELAQHAGEGPHERG